MGKDKTRNRPTDERLDEIQHQLLNLPDTEEEELDKLRDEAAGCIVELRASLAAAERPRSLTGPYVPVRELDRALMQLAAAKQQLSGNAPHPDRHKIIASRDEIKHMLWEKRDLREKFAAAEQRADTLLRLNYNQLGMMRAANAAHDLALTNAAVMGDALQKVKGLIEFVECEFYADGQKLDIATKIIIDALTASPKVLGEGYVFVKPDGERVLIEHDTSGKATRFILIAAGATP